MRKRFVISFLAGCTMAVLAACSPVEQAEPAVTETAQESVETEDSGETETEETAAEPGETDETPGAGGDALVVYFSWSGNTRSVAEEIEAQTGADVFEIVPAEPYTDDYDTLLEIAQEEQAAEARPEIADSVENWEDYEVIYLGYPNWWGDMPMILYSFLDSYDLSGKTVAPFVTSGGSGFSGTIGMIESLEPGAEVLEGLSLGSSQAAQPEEAVAQWLGELGLN